MQGGTYPAVLAGADEAAVALFLNGYIKFTQIPEVVLETLYKHKNTSEPSVEDIGNSARWGIESTLARHKKPTIVS